jgi:uroporphyrinogen-III synthase
MALHDQRVLVTRPAHQADNLCQLLQARGAVAVRLPTLAIEPLAESAVKIAQIPFSNYQWLVFTSTNAVNFALNVNGGKIADLLGTRIAAIGQATAHALSHAGYPVDVLPVAPYNSEALLADPQLQTIASQRFLIIQGANGRETLAQGLRARGAVVDNLIVYQRSLPTIARGYSAECFAAPLAALTFTSGEAVQNLLTLVDAVYYPQLFATPSIVISERIQHIAYDLGFKHISVTANPSDNAIVAAVITCLTGK